MASSSYSNPAPRPPRPWPRFVVPQAWIDFIAAIDERTGKPVEQYGFWTVCARLMTADEQARAASLLQAFMAVAETDPNGLNVELHYWASSLTQDVREGEWWRCRREGCLRQLRRVREAQRRAAAIVQLAGRAA